MPRVARGFVDGAVYHVVNRGNGRQEVFHKPADFVAFVALIAEAKERYPVRVLGYCLMTNHFHLLLQPELGDDLSKWMQWLMTSHVRRYHRHYRSSGHIWQGRFKSFVISENDHLLAAIRYVEGNPVRAGMVTSALDWPWSSHRENAGTGSAGMAVPVPLDQEGEQQGEGQAPLEPVPGEAVKKGQAPAEPVPGAVPVVDAGMVKLPSDWTDFVDTPLTLKELSRLGLAPARLPVPAFIDSDSLIGM